MLMYVVWLCVQRQYNYDRLNLWHALLTLALLSLSVAAHIANFRPAAFVQLFGALLGE